MLQVSEMPMHVLLSTFVAVFVANATWAVELDWPQFRGPRGDGTSMATKVPTQWSETNNLAWKVSVPGRGRSSPVVLGERVWLTTAIERNVVRTNIGPDDMQVAEHISLEAICLDTANGKTLWRTKLFDVDNPDPVHWFNSWATPTPVVEPGRLYCDFGTFGTACLDSKNGKIIWRERLPLDHQVGPGSSPVLYKDLLVLVRDGRDAQYVTALDKKSGKPVWKTERPPIEVSSPNLKKSFVTPLLIEANGKEQLISPTAHWIVSYAPATGKEIWRARHGTGFSIGSCPVFGHGMALFSTGCTRPQLCSFRVDGEGDVTTTHAGWKATRQIPVMSSPVLAGDDIYWVSDEGFACCSDVKSGEVNWQERFAGPHLASPLLAEGRVYFFSREGKTTVVRAGKQFDVLAENSLEEPLMATPAVVDGAIFLRTDTYLYRIGKK